MVNTDTEEKTIKPKGAGWLRTPTAIHQSFYGEAISSLIKNFCLTLYLLIC